MLRPRRFFKCQKFGHGAKACRSPVNICARCGASDDRDQPCTRDAKCHNCGEAHPASSVRCPDYTFEQEVLELQTRDRISFADARRIVRSRTPRLGASYAAVAASRTDSPAVHRQAVGVATFPKPITPKVAPANTKLDHALQAKDQSPAVVVCPPKLAASREDPSKGLPSLVAPTVSGTVHPGVKTSSQTRKPDTVRSKTVQTSQGASVKRPADDEGAERSAASRRRTSLIGDYPVPSYAPTSLPPKKPPAAPSHGIEVRCSSRYDSLTNQDDMDAAEVTASRQSK